MALKLSLQKALFGLLPFAFLLLPFASHILARAELFCARESGNYPSPASVFAVSDDEPLVNCAAFGFYNATSNQTGWNYLSLTSNETKSDTIQAYMMGFLEGYVTAEDIVNFHHNTVGPSGSFGPVNEAVRSFVERNDQWMRKEADKKKATDARWATVALMLDQIQGMLDGVNAAGFNYTRIQFLLSLNMPDVVSDLEAVFPTAKTSKIPMLQKLHCSSLVKVTNDLSDLYFGHATWMNYNTMLRVFKILTFNFNGVPLAAKTSYFSSYPGAIASTDDFYTLSSGLGVMETSFSIFNTSLYDVLTPESLFSSFRSTLANRMARDGKDWGELFAFHNSGTYNNQWIIVDMNKFNPGVGLATGTLTIVEQLPGYVETSDQTEALSFGYWPSYNVPISKKLFDLAGYNTQLPGHPNFNSYQNSVRAKLFRELQGTVQTVEDMKYVLQYNQYNTNPTEKMDPLYAIAARGDLLEPVGQAFGALDCKITAYSQFMKGLKQPSANKSHYGPIHAFSGPTPQQGPFNFLTSNATGLTPHVGLPAVFNFTWQIYNKL